MLIASLIDATAAARQNAQSAAPIRTEFRVFDGVREVTPDTRLRVRPSGSSEHVLAGTPIERDDDIRPGLDRDIVLSQAPDAAPEPGFFRVPRVIG